MGAKQSRQEQEHASTRRRKCSDERCWCLFLYSSRSSSAASFARSVRARAPCSVASVTAWRAQLNNPCQLLNMQTIFCFSKSLPSYTVCARRPVASPK